MRVFVTGATGFVGSAVVPELLKAGHTVVGLARSEASAAKLVAAGVDVIRGGIEDLSRLQEGAGGSDGVIHLAFNYDFSQLEQSAAHEREAIKAIGESLRGSARPFLVTSATAMAQASNGPLVLESDMIQSWNPRAEVEKQTRHLMDFGVNVAIVRLPQVHNTEKQGFIPSVIDWARQKGVSAYVNGGLNRWPAAHVSDVAVLYRLALERGKSGEVYHAVDEEGIAFREIAETIAAGLAISIRNVDEHQADEQFGWLSKFVILNNPSSSMYTRAALGWKPAGPGLLSDLQNAQYNVER